MNRRPVYTSGELRIVSRPNGLWMAQRLRLGQPGTPFYDPWQDLQNLNGTRKEAELRVAQEAKAVRS